MPACAQVSLLTSNSDADCSIGRVDVEGNGASVVFDSDCDLTGGNADGNREVFLYDRVSSVGVQITDTVGCSNAAPSINDDGSGVAFDSDCNLDGMNSDGSREIYLWDGANSSQMTDAAGCSSSSASFAGDGALIAFESDCDHVGLNGDASVEVFQTTISAIVVQRTNDTSSSGCSSRSAVSDATGSAVAFVSDCDLTGANSAGVDEIFRYAGGVFQLTTAPTGSSCSSANPSIRADGISVIFESDCDLLGTNGDGGRELYRTIGEAGVQQLTSDDAAPVCQSVEPAALDDGRVVYSSDCDPLLSNGDSNREIFESGGVSSLQQIDTTGCTSSSPAVSAGPLLVAYTSDCNSNGQGSDGTDDVFFFFAACACGSPVSRVDGSATATDALYTLSAAVGLEACRLCDCDVDSGGSITALDALLTLSAAVGAGGELDCPDLGP